MAPSSISVVVCVVVVLEVSVVVCSAFVDTKVVVTVVVARYGIASMHEQAAETRPETAGLPVTMGQRPLSGVADAFHDEGDALTEDGAGDHLAEEVDEGFLVEDELFAAEDGLTEELDLPQLLPRSPLSQSLPPRLLSSGGNKG